MTALLEFQRRIATRIDHGRSRADAEREIIGSPTLDEAQLPALRLYANGLLRARRRGDSPLLSLAREGAW